MEDSEMKILMKVNLTVIASLSYCYFISSKIPKGTLRFLSISPILFLFTILPLHLSSLLSIALTSVFITWLSSFKLILFSFQIGPLSSPNSLPLFLLIACFPIKTNQNPKNSPKLPLNFPIKTLLFLLLLRTLNDGKQYFHPKVILLLHSCFLYLLVDVVLGLCNSVMKPILGIELELPSNEPYLSTSLQDFWGRRWNLMVTNVLRHTVYKPVRSFLGPVLGPQWAQSVGVFATFVVSGLMHELIYYYVTRATPTWEVTWFFVLHGVCLVVEIGVKRLLGRQRLGLHWAVSGPITVAFVVVTAEWLFFPQLLRNGVDERAVKEFGNVVHCVMGKLGLRKLNF